MTMTREQWLAAFTDAARPIFADAGAPLPALVRCGIGFPSKGARSRVIGECWDASASTDSAVEIFIRPSLQSDSARIADVLTHELCHAALGAVAGHGPAFKRLAVKLGLEGKMTATIAGDAWRAWALPILAKLGDLPGSELLGSLAGGKKKQTTRMIKLECDSCGWSCRTARGNISDDLSCPTNCGGDLREA